MTDPDSMTAQEYRDMESPSERELQEAIIEWARHQPGPASLLYANVNGQYRPGQRPEPGLTPGIPDLTLPVPRKGGGVLYIELKVNGRQLTDAQEEMIEKLRDAGNTVCVCRSLDQTIKVVQTHIESHEKR